MILEHWFWWGLVMFCVAWYATVTVYVAFKGISDIKNMIRRLTSAHDRTAEHDS